MADHPRYQGATEDTGAVEDDAAAAREPLTARQRRARVLVIAIVAGLFLAIVILHITGALGPGTNG
jgi:hypothetical protein